MSKPTDEDLETTRDTLQWIIDRLREYEPGAVNSIAAIEAALLELPMSTEHWED